LLPGTEPQRIEPALKDLDHVLIFSGDLGNFGGHADLSLLEKVEFIKNKAPDIEVGWDGGINLMNVSELVTGGVDVLNVGGFIQKANDPQKAYSDLMRIVEETGTT
jgi:pentose-5-phosphate-3-epimerase